MPTCKEFGLQVALGLIVTVVVFPLGFFASRALWPTSSQCEADPVFDPENPGILIPALKRLNVKQVGLFMTRTEIFMLNWCQAFPSTCLDGTFPTEGHEADVVRNHRDAFDALALSSVAPNETDAWHRCLILGTLNAALKRDNDRCCQTIMHWKIMSGYKDTVNGVSCFLPSFDNTFQAISNGGCYGSHAGCTAVNGQCCKPKQRPVVLPCVPIGSRKLEFGVFNVDSYCSCQSTC